MAQGESGPSAFARICGVIGALFGGALGLDSGFLAVLFGGWLGYVIGAGLGELVSRILFGAVVGGIIGSVLAPELMVVGALIGGAIQLIVRSSRDGGAAPTRYIGSNEHHHRSEGHRYAVSSEPDRWATESEHDVPIIIQSVGSSRAPSGIDPRGMRCAVCLTNLTGADGFVVCPSCEAVYHAECWQEMGGCSVYGCAG